MSCFIRFIDWLCTFSSLHLNSLADKIFNYPSRKSTQQKVMSRCWQVFCYRCVRQCDDGRSQASTRRHEPLTLSRNSCRKSKSSIVAFFVWGVRWVGLPSRSSVAETVFAENSRVATSNAELWSSIIGAIYSETKKVQVADHEQNLGTSYLWQTN